MSDAVFTALLRCHNISEGREPILKENGDPSGRTIVRSISASLWDHDIPPEVHTDRRQTAILTTMVAGEFDFFQDGGVYRIIVERVR